MNESPYIINVSADNFTREVLDRSGEAPVLADFWAAWCAPCKALMPVLVKLAEEFQGQLYIAKINIDEQQELAAQFAIRSVPTLKLFRHGQEVAQLTGAQPEEVLRGTIEPYLNRAADKVRAEALLLHAQGRSAEAAGLLRQAIAGEPHYYRLHQDLLTVLSESSRFGEARALFDGLPANIQAESAVQAVLPRLVFGEILEHAPPRAELAAQAHPDDLRAHYQLSAHQVMAGEFPAALDNLLAIMRADRGFEDDGARKRIVDIFTLLGDDPLVPRYRAKLSALLY